MIALLNRGLRQRIGKLFAMAMAAVSIAGLHTNASADAAQFPAKPIKFIVPFPAGSGADSAARVFAKQITQIGGQAVIVENRPGANGFIGVKAALDAPADGYTVFLGSNSTFSTNAATFKNLPYDPVADFTPITMITRGPCVVVVPANSRYKKMQDLIDDARKRPGALNYGSGSVSYALYSEWLNELAKMKTTAVPYKGSSEALADTVTGTVDFSVVDSGIALGMIKGGKLRALMIAAPQRSTLLPDVPTSAELGFPEYQAFNWGAAAVSAKTPKAIVERLVELFSQAGKSQEVINFYSNQSTNELFVTGPLEFRKYQVEEIERWRGLMQKVGMERQ